MTIPNDQEAISDDSIRYTDEVTCPHCGYEEKGSGNMADGTYNCPNCDGVFIMRRKGDVTYSTPIYLQAWNRRA